jgi:hypothetical protein
MCGLESGDLHKDRDELGGRIQNRVSRHLAYACTYWASHLVSGLGDDVEFDREVKQLLERFATEHLLTWLEVLSVVGRVDAAYRSLNTMYAMMVRANCSNEMIRKYSCETPDQERADTHMVSDTAREIFYDGCRFIQRNVEGIKALPMHVYYSALSFTPKSTALFCTYKKRFPGALEVISGTENTWTPLIAVIAIIRDFASEVYVAFSADSSRLASLSNRRGAQLWDAQTGAHIATLESHSADTHSLIFSADGSRLVSASYDGMARLWDGKQAPTSPLVLSNAVLSGVLSGILPSDVPQSHA